jgi:hypothetical protein
MCSDRSRFQRRDLCDVDRTSGEGFDPVVVAFRSPTREFRVEKALDYDHPIQE